MIKSKGKIFTLAAAFALTAALTAGVFAPAAAEEAQFPVYTQEFTSEEAVNADFFAGYVNAVGNSTVAEHVGQENDCLLYVRIAARQVPASLSMLFSRTSLPSFKNQ